MGSPHPRKAVAGDCQQSEQGGHLLLLVLVQIFIISWPLTTFHRGEALGEFKEIG